MEHDFSVGKREKKGEGVRYNERGRKGRGEKGEEDVARIMNSSSIILLYLFFFPS